jgi:cytochrome c553
MNSRQYFAAIVLAGTLSLGTQPRAHASEEGAEQLTRNALSLDANRVRGAALFRSNCAECHGKRAFGDAKRVIPSLAGQRRAYLIKQLADFAEHDRTATQMHRVVAQANVGDPQAWADLAGYLNSLRIPTANASQKGNGKLVGLGEASYQQWCASCHADDGRGDDDGFVPSLRNQHFTYLLKEMQAMAAGHRINLDPELMRFMDSLEADELAGIADYVSRLRGPVVDRARLKDDGSLTD